MTAFAATGTSYSKENLWSPDHIKQIGPNGNSNMHFVPDYDEFGNLTGYTNAYILARDAKGNRVDTSFRELSQGVRESLTEEKVINIYKEIFYF